MTPVESAIRDFVREHAEGETRFLAEIVKPPSDNPPGDCSGSAEVFAAPLDARPLRRQDCGRLARWARSRSVEVGHCDLRIRDAGARKVRRGAQWRGRVARHL